MKNKEKIMIVDAMNLIHRSYYAFPKLKAKDDRPTGAIYGFIKYMKSLNDNYQPDQIIACSDAHRRSFRNDIYEDYKGTRGETE